MIHRSRNQQHFKLFYSLYLSWQVETFNEEIDCYFSFTVLIKLMHNTDVMIDISAKIPLYGSHEERIDQGIKNILNFFIHSIDHGR